MALAVADAMGVKRLEDLIAFQRAVAFKEAVYAVVAAHPAAVRDHAYRSQLFEAASSVEANIAEAWGRWGAGEMRQFLRYAAGSLREAERRLRDGTARGYFPGSDCDVAFSEARRCLVATVRLHNSLEPFARRPPRSGTQHPRRPFNWEPPDPADL